MRRTGLAPVVNTISGCRLTNLATDAQVGREEDASPSPGLEPGVFLLDHSPAVVHRGIEPRSPGPKPGVFRQRTRGLRIIKYRVPPI